ncbi:MULTISPECIES: hypothetical protein [unclassified Streptomyces]|uniref:hypothetical protein n=1 Tax=unclassified Streptomyces TaxID=2593676 RepID=UPI0011A12F8E|nr:hypothetical protein [Streptomyces sp. BK340]TVZ82392.1 hypothetical protein FB157_125153 [Streptomyces sp. BK340]
MRSFNRISLGIIVVVVAFFLFQRFGPGGLPALPLPGPLQRPDPVEVHAEGDPPWTIEGHGVRFEVVSTTRTSSSWMGATRPSIRVVSYVTRTEGADFKGMQYRFSDQASGAALETVPFQGGGDGDPPPHQRSRLETVIWDVSPRATRLTITLHDFYWPDERNLVLRDVRVPAS